MASNYFLAQPMQAVAGSTLDIFGNLSEAWIRQQGVDYEGNEIFDVLLYGNGCQWPNYYAVLLFENIQIWNVTHLTHVSGHDVLQIEENDLLVRTWTDGIIGGISGTSITGLDGKQLFRSRQVLKNNRTWAKVVETITSNQEMVARITHQYEPSNVIKEVKIEFCTNLSSNVVKALVLSLAFLMTIDECYLNHNMPAAGSPPWELQSRDQLVNDEAIPPDQGPVNTTIVAQERKSESSTPLTSQDHPPHHPLPAATPFSEDQEPFSSKSITTGLLPLDMLSEIGSLTFKKIGQTMYSASQSYFFLVQNAENCEKLLAVEASLDGLMQFLDLENFQPILNANNIECADKTSVIWVNDYGTIGQLMGDVTIQDKIKRHMFGVQEIRGQGFAREYSIFRADEYGTKESARIVANKNSGCLVLQLRTQLSVLEKSLILCYVSKIYSNFSSFLLRLFPTIERSPAHLRNAINLMTLTTPITEEYGLDEPRHQALPDLEGSSLEDLSQFQDTKEMKLEVVGFRHAYGTYYLTLSDCSSQCFWIIEFITRGASVNSEAEVKLPESLNTLLFLKNLFVYKLRSDVHVNPATPLGYVENGQIHDANGKKVMYIHFPKLPSKELWHTIVYRVFRCNVPGNFIAQIVSDPNQQIVTLTMDEDLPVEWKALIISAMLKVAFNTYKIHTARKHCIVAGLEEVAEML